MVYGLQYSTVLGKKMYPGLEGLLYTELALLPKGTFWAAFFMQQRRSKEILIR